MGSVANKWRSCGGNAVAAAGAGGNGSSVAAAWHRVGSSEKIKHLA